MRHWESDIALFLLAGIGAVAVMSAADEQAVQIVEAVKALFLGLA